MPGLKKIKEIKLSPSDAGSGGIWNMVADEGRRRCYFLSQANVAGFDDVSIGCIAYVNDEYVLHETTEIKGSETMTVNQRNGNLFFGYLGDDDQAYQVRILDPNNNYVEVGTIDIPPLDPTLLDDRLFSNMVFSNKSGRLYIYSAPEVETSPLTKNTFQFIVCDGLKNEFIQSTGASVDNNVGLEGSFKIYNDTYGFVVNDQINWHGDETVGVIHSGICVYNIQENKVSLIDHSTFIINQEEFNPTDVCVDERWKALFTFIQNDKNSGILPITLNSHNFGTPQKAIIYKKVNSEGSIMFYDKDSSLIYNIYNANNQTNQKNVVLIDPFNNTVRYDSGIEEKINTFAFDQTNRLLYVANDDKNTVSIFEVMR